jgi:hypothetical protein
MTLFNETAYKIIFQIRKEAAPTNKPKRKLKLILRISKSSENPYKALEIYMSMMPSELLTELTLL